MPAESFHVLEIALYSLLNLIPYVVIALFTFRGRMRFSRPVTVVLLIALSIVQIGIGMCACLFYRQAVGAISFLGYIIYFGFFLLAVKTSFGPSLFVMFMLANYASLVVTLSKLLEYIIFGELALESYRYSFAIATLIVQLVTLPPIAAFTHKKIRPALNQRDAEKLWNYLWIIPFTFYIVWFYASYVGNAGLTSLQIALTPVTSLFLLLINIGSLVVYYVVTRMVSDNAKRIELERINHSLSMRSVQLEHLQQRINEARRARHDTRQHYSAILALCDKGDANAVRSYIEPLFAGISAEGALVYCANTVVNAITVYYSDKAKQLGADISIRLDLPQKLPFDDTDLTVLFGNLLENAVEAIERQHSGKRFLRVSAIYTGSLILTADNSYDSVITRSNSGFISSKRDEQGIGVLSARAIAQKYNGTASFEYENGVFKASVLLNSTQA